MNFYLIECCFRLCRLRRFFRNVAFAEFFCKMSLSQGSAHFRFLFFALNFVKFFCSRLFAKFFDLRSWLSVSSPLRSVGTPSPLPRGFLFFKPRQNREAWTSNLELYWEVLHFRKSEKSQLSYHKTRNLSMSVCSNLYAKTRKPGSRVMSSYFIYIRIPLTRSCTWILRSIFWFKFVDTPQSARGDSTE